MDSKSKFCLFLIKHRDIKVHGRVEVYIHTLLNSPLDGVEQSASHHERFTHDTYPIRGWMGPNAGLDPEENIEVCCIYRESNTDSPVGQPKG